MLSEVRGHGLFQRLVTATLVVVAVRNHATLTVERDICDATALGITEATRLMRISTNYM